MTDCCKRLIYRIVNWLYYPLKGSNMSYHHVTSQSLFELEALITSARSLSRANVVDHADRTTWLHILQRLVVSLISLRTIHGSSDTISYCAWSKLISMVCGHNSKIQPYDLVPSQCTALCLKEILSLYVILWWIFCHHPFIVANKSVSSSRGTSYLNPFFSLNV